MANTIEKAKIYQKELDQQMVAQAVTGWMEGNAGKIIYNGGDEVKIPKIVMDGLGNYDRDTGYPEGSVTLAYETMKMTHDRAQSFNIDAMDVDESGLDSLAGMLMGEFQSAYVVPEVDACRLSTIYKIANDKNKVHTAYTPAKNTVLDALKGDISGVQDVIGEGVPLVIHMSFAAAALFDTSEALSRQLSVMDFERGEVKLKVKGIDNIPILRTPSARLKTAYTYNDGTEKFGFEAAEDAKAINWIILPANAPLAVCRTDTIRIFDPATYQKANAWHLDYRKYHDLWIPDNRAVGLCANIGA